MFPLNEFQIQKTWLLLRTQMITVGSIYLYSFHEEIIENRRNRWLGTTRFSVANGCNLWITFRIFIDRFMRTLPLSRNCSPALLKPSFFWTVRFPRYLFLVSRAIRGRARMSKCYGMDCFGTYFTHVQTCDVTRVQTATEWTASVHTSHMSKPVM